MPNYFKSGQKGARGPSDAKGYQPDRTKEARPGFSPPKNGAKGTGKKQNRAEVEQDDLDEIPFYLRESIQKIIDRRVLQRVNEEMIAFKEEIRSELADQKVQNQIQIGHHTYTGRPYSGFTKDGKYNIPHYAAGHPYPHAYGYGHPYSGFGGYGHPGYLGHPGDLRDPYIAAQYRQMSPDVRANRQLEKEWKK